MILGTGIDIIEIKRIEKAYNSNPKFARRILSEKEWDKFEALGEKRKTTFLAGRFAAKEAFSKALGTGIGMYSFQKIIVENDEKGRPFISEPFVGKVHLSISHSQDYAVAQVMIESIEE